MLAEATEDVLRFDSKFYRSILHLLLKPGYLSWQFIVGKRVSILPPIRMYLVISLIFFFVFEIPTPDVREQNVYLGNVLVGKEEPVPGQPYFSLIRFDENDPIFGQWLKGFMSDNLESLKTQDPQMVINRIFKELEELVPHALILFLPVVALILKLFYLFKKALYFDHLIFCLHFQSWLMMMILIIYGLTHFDVRFSALSIVLPIYLARAQKVVYDQTYWLVIPKTLILILVYFVALTIFALLSIMFAIASA